MSPVLKRLPVVVVYPHTRCNCRCVMCDIWKRTDAGEIDVSTFERYLDDFAALGVEWVVFSGGEPLMHSHIQRLCASTRGRGIRTTVLTTGLLLERHAAWLADTVDDVIVSLDGPAVVHDRIRGIPGAFVILERGVKAVRDRNPGFAISARCTVQRWNHGVLPETAAAAYKMDLGGISFLAADSTSPAFDHTPERLAAAALRLTLDQTEVETLARGVEKLIAEWDGRGFVAESPAKLRRIINHFRAHLGLCEASAPVCNAPWVSAVIEADGTVRPCFFHPPIGRTGDAGFIAALNSPAAAAFRAGLEVATDPVCRRCVCSLNRPQLPEKVSSRRISCPSDP